MQPWLYPAYSGKALLDVELGIPFGDAVAGDRRREPALWTGRARASGTATRRRGSGKRTPPWRGRPTRRASRRTGNSAGSWRAGRAPDCTTGACWVSRRCLTGAEPCRSAISTPSRSASMRSTPRWAKSWHPWAPGVQSSRRFAASTGRRRQRPHHGRSAAGLDRRAAQRRRRGQALCGRQGGPRPFWRAQLPPGPACHSARLGFLRARGGPRRGRDAPARAQRRAGEEPERPTAGDRRDRLRTLPGPLPRDHRDARSSRDRRGCGGCRPSPSGSRWTSPARPGSTIRAPCRCGGTTSTSRGSRVSGGRFAISMPGALPLRRVSSWSREPA